jgi:SNF2 family DNA or RNA helicase
MAELNSNDIVLTTYNTVLRCYKSEKQVNPSEVTSESSHDEDAMDDPKESDGCPNRVVSSSSLYSVDWDRVVFDEAHRIRRLRNKTTHAILELKSMYRLCLTGTPFQNVLGDIHSLFKFLRVEPGGYHFCQ